MGFKPAVITKKLWQMDDESGKRQKMVVCGMRRIKSRRVVPKVFGLTLTG